MIRPLCSIGLGLAIVLASTFTLSAADTAAGDRFTFARPPAPNSTVDPGDRLTFAVDRWSTDAERDQLVASINTNGSEKLLDAFRDVPRLGTLSWPGGTEYTVRFARRAARPDGGSDLVLVVDRPLWLWWESNPPSTPYPFSVVQIKLGKDGMGEGRVSAGVPVSTDKSLGVVLSDYARGAAVFTDVRQERPTS